MMANPHKKVLSKGLSDMKFMKRRSGNKSELDDGGVLTDKWVVPNVPETPSLSTRLEVIDSYVEFEELNQFGRFSYNQYNKDIERLMVAYNKQWDKDTLSEGEVEEEMEEEVSVIATEVAKRYEELGMKTSSKVLGKRQRSKP